MDAVVTAGGIPQPDEPLYAFTQGDSKAMIDIAGKPMIQWVLDALSEAKTVDNVIVTGLSLKSNLKCKKPVHYLPNQGKMLDNLIAGINKSLELNPKNKHVLLVSSDIPALKAEMVDWLKSGCPMETVQSASNMELRNRRIPWQLVLVLMGMQAVMSGWTPRTSGGY